MIFMFQKHETKKKLFFDESWDLALGSLVFGSLTSQV